MKKFTIFEIAKLLNFNDQEIKDIETDYKASDEAKRCETMDIFYDSYFELLDKLAKIKYNQFMEEASEGKRELKTDLYQQAKRAVWTDFENILAGKPQEVDQLDEIRNKLKNFTQGAISKNSTSVTTPAH